MITRCRPAWVLLSFLLLAGPQLALAAEGAPDARPILSGIAIDSLGRRVAGVEIVLSPAGAEAPAPVTTARSDENGHFVVGGLAPGAYRVVAVKGGYSVLVGKIDTLLRDTLELVLRPAGQSAAPGVRPSDSSWVLRLADRDSLESLSHALYIDGDSEMQDLPFTGPMLVELHSTSLGGAGTSDGGINAMIAGELPVDGIGKFGLSFRHQAETTSRLSESADLLSLHWLPDGEVSSGVPAFQIDTLRRSRLAEGVASQGGMAQYQSEGARFQTTWAVLSPGRALNAQIDGAVLRGEQQSGGNLVPWQEFDAQRLTMSLGLHRAWGEHHETVASVRVRESRGVAFDSSGGGQQVLSMMTLADGPTSLGIAQGGSVDFTMVDRWSPRARMALHTRWRAEREFDAPSGLRLAAGVGGRWDTPLGFSIEAEGALSSGESGTQGQWAVALSRAGEDWHWSVGRAREAGLVPWEEEQFVRGPGTTGLVTDRDGKVERWVVLAGWKPGKRWPLMTIRGERYDMEGRLATRLQGDMPIVPISGDGSGVGMRMEVTLHSTRIGTWVSLAWSQIEDRGPEQVLLSGAPMWRGRELNLRQSLGAGWAGLSWQILLNLEEGRLPRSEADQLQGRMALLAQRRVSGGLAVIF